jgi:transcriptional regulator with XRE-family HTH domain
MNDLRHRFGALLKERRPNLEPPLNTQEGLAAHLGVQQPAVSAWERGLAIPESPVFLALVTLLGLTQEEIAALNAKPGRRTKKAVATS